MTSTHKPEIKTEAKPEPYANASVVTSTTGTKAESMLDHSKSSEEEAYQRRWQTAALYHMMGKEEYEHRDSGWFFDNKRC